MFLCLVAAELLLRIGYGLGDPPLSIADADIEYLFAPSQEVRRLGNRIKYNAYSMRSDDFPRHKTDPREMRVMVIGDSIINGGAQTDQSELATAILQERLRARLRRPVVVGNISAGSWGPVNMLAYARKFGLFDADVVVIVLSSHDYGDVPDEPFTPVVGVHPNFPDRRPVLAVQELFTRYLLPRFRTGAEAGDASVPVDHPPEQVQVQRSLKAVSELIALARSTGARVIVAQYQERREMTEGLLPGYALIEQTARDAGADVVPLGPAQRQSLDRGADPFRDVLHPNTTGQRVIGDVLYGAIDAISSEPPLSAPTTGRAPNAVDTD